MNEVFITPLNCGGFTGLTSLMTYDESEYNASATRKILVKDPLQSWFKFKSITTSTPYIEPIIYGLNVGDSVIFEFEALISSGVGQLVLNTIGIDNTNTIIWYNYDNLANTLKTHFKKYKVEIPIERVDTNQIGHLFNLRPMNNDTNNSEIIVKNIKMSIKTSNSNLKLKNHYIEYNNKRDYLNVINLYSGTTLRPSYLGLKELYDLSEVTFPDVDTIEFTGTTTGKFRGLMAMMSRKKYPNNLCVFIEYINNDSNSVAIYVTGITKNNVENAIISNSVIELASSYTKKMWYGTNTVNEYMNLFMDVGRSGTAPNYEIKRIIFSNPRFDDFDIKEINKLDELYDDIGEKLRV